VHFLLGNGGATPMTQRIGIVALLLILVAAAFWVVFLRSRVADIALPPYTPNLDNGRTMFFAGGCASCHTRSDQEDKTRLGGGARLTTAFGNFYAPNISPDPDDGIGRWSEADFVWALWNGLSPDGSDYFPVFPYTSFQRMRLDDVRDLFAYLRTLPPVSGRVPEHQVPFPFNFRRAIVLWKFLFLDGKPFQPDPRRSAEWNRGAYLANGPGHCAECHSPRNWFGGIVASQRYAGAPNPEGEGWVPNITQKRLANWSVDDIAEVLDSGETPDGDSVGSSMVATVRNTSQLTTADRNAIAVYIKSLPPVDGPLPPPPKS
jgi:mono/diheme cytochrome c family protein